MSRFIRPLLFCLMIFSAASTSAAALGQQEARRFLERYFTALKTMTCAGLPP